jgi:hypothetical protein
MSSNYGRCSFSFLHMVHCICDVVRCTSAKNEYFRIDSASTNVLKRNLNCSGIDYNDRNDTSDHSESDDDQPVDDDDMKSVDDNVGPINLDTIF